MADGRGSGVRCRGNTWFIPYDTIQSREKDRPHPATFPPKLPEMCVRLHGLDRARTGGRPVHGPRLDGASPARRSGVDFVGIEMDEGYLKEAVARVRPLPSTAREPDAIAPATAWVLLNPCSFEMYAGAWICGSSRSSAPSPRPARSRPPGNKLHVSQSAISRQIILLEDELGEAVFHRVGRRVRITPAGESLLQLSHRVFQDLQDTVAAISDTRESLRGTIRLVGGMTVCLYVFPSLLAEVRRIHPNLDLKVTVGSAERSIAMLRAGRRRPGPGHAAGGRQRLRRRCRSSRKSCCSSPTRRTRWPRRRQITPADLDQQPFILFETGSITRRLVEEFFTREGIESHIVMETENVEIIKAMVRNGLGISIIPWQAAAADVRQKQLFCSRIAGHPLTRQTGWLYPKMSRLPRMVAEVMQVVEAVRPRLEAAVKPAGDLSVALVVAAVAVDD